MDCDTIFTEDNHPSKHDILGKPKEYLTERKRYVKMAISDWEQNKYMRPLDRVKYNLHYFGIELKIIDSELNRINTQTK